MSSPRRAAASRSPEFAEGRARRGIFGGPTLVVFWFFVVAACVAVAIPAIPQYHKLREIEEELAEIRREEEQMKEMSLRLEAEAQALQDNPRYLEARARDTLRYHLDGETVIQLDD